MKQPLTFITNNKLDKKSFDKLLYTSTDCHST